MQLKLSDLWRTDGTTDRGTYLFWGVLLFAAKFNLDRLVGWLWFGRVWTIFDWENLRFYLWQSVPGRADTSYYLAILATSLPFLWSGVALTVRRLRSLGWGPWWVLLFLAPVLKLIFFSLLCILPSKNSQGAPETESVPEASVFDRLIPHSATGSAVVAITISVAGALGLTWLGATLLGNYGGALFVGLPFCMGFLASLVYSYHEPRRLWACLLVANCSVALAAVGVLLVAIEGLLCVIMAAPIALVISSLGGALGWAVQQTFRRPDETPRLFCGAILLVPLMMWLEREAPPPEQLMSVTTSVVVDAPPSRVWQHVVSFSELPPPTELMFRLGIAYPVRAEIWGRGVGAIRHCNFSTGPFIEPIETWDEPRLLKFSVTQNPAPMQEWTPYRDVHPPHLNGYLESREGQFRLTPMEGGRTLLEGTTWYRHHLWPAGYWKLWSDGIIHTIHRRVLNHVKSLSEKDGP